MNNDTGVWLSLRYDLRAPSFGPPAAALYRAALEQCAWAEDHGFAMVTLRASGDYLVLTPDECVATVQGTGSLLLHPLMGGLDPDLAWESLELVAAKVIPRLAEPA